jgi:phage terminase small subunit
MKTAKKHWNPEAKNYWRRMHAIYTIEERDFPALAQACECITQLATANQSLAKDGAMIRSGKILKKNPALELVKVAQSGLMQALRILKVEDDIPRRPGRPAGGSKDRISADFTEDDDNEA